MANYTLYIFYYNKISKTKIISTHYLTENQWPNVHSKKSQKQLRRCLRGQVCSLTVLGSSLSTKRSKTSAASAELTRPQGHVSVNFTITHPISVANTLDSHLCNSYFLAAVITCSSELTVLPYANSH